MIRFDVLLMKTPPDRWIPFWYSPEPKKSVNVKIHGMYGYKIWLEKEIIMIIM